MSQLSYWTRMIVLAAVASAVGAWSVQSTVQQPDLLRAFAKRDTHASVLESDFQRLGPFAGRLFVAASGLLPTEHGELASDLAQAGYRSLEQGARGEYHNIYEILGAASMKAAGLSPKEAGSNAARKLALTFSLPGLSDASMLQDPLGFLAFLAARAPALKAIQNQASVAVWERQTPFSFESGKILWQVFEKWDPKVKMIGEDLFRFANESTIRSDVVNAAIIGTVLNVALFVLFVRSANFLLIFCVGSLCSWALMSIVLKYFFLEVYPVVYGFGSTFLSFNAEYLVHLCGISSRRTNVIRRALISAVGTTVIGLLVLCFSSSPLFHQMSVGALAAMAGFFLATLPFMSYLTNIHLPVPVVSVPKRQQPWPWQRIRYWAALTAVLAVCMCTFYRPQVETDIRDFRFSGAALDRNEKYFNDLRPSRLQPVAVAGASLDKILSPGTAKEFLAVSQGISDLQELSSYMQSVRSEAEAKLLTLGIEASSDGLFSSTSQASRPTNEILSKSACEAFALSCLSNGWVAAFVSTDVLAELAAENTKYISLDPKQHYNSILTGYTWETLRLFSAALSLIAVYLIIVQRSVGKVAVILLPLVLFCGLGGLLLTILGINLNIIHVIGLILVIGFSLDYTAIAVSTNYAAADRAKILLTGASTTASFLGLCAARHPFLQELGVVVVLGVMISLVFTICISDGKVSSELFTT